MHRTLLVVTVMTALSCGSLGAGANEGTPQVAPTVKRPAGAGAPVLWPVFGAENGGAELRMCCWWHDGWERFAEERALPVVRHYGRVWVHNPGGFIPGEDMKFQQFSDASAQAKLSASPALGRIADWEEFTRQMNRIVKEGDLAVYVGCPATMHLAEGETDEQWLVRAWRELAPVRGIEKKPLLGFDATIGQPADPRQGQWSRFGGPRGLVAQLFRKLHAEGYELTVEPSILMQATWLNEISGTVATEFWWDRMLGGKDTASPCGVAGWGDHLRPSQVRGRQVRYLFDLWRKPKEKQWPIAEATLAAGYDIAVSVYECPGYPVWEEDKANEEAAEAPPQPAEPKAD
ncbi:MAG: hypothetical protein ACRCT8_13725 [Lacipirellulaceae bacterium]